MRMLRLAFTARFIAYTLSILFTVALLLIVVTYPPAFGIAAIPLAVFAWLAVLDDYQLICWGSATLCRRHSR